MIFNSSGFILFLPAVLAVFALIKADQRWIVVLVASYVFYSFTGIFNLIALTAISATAYLFGLMIDSAKTGTLRKRYLSAGLALALGSLAVLKFYDFLASELERAITGTINIQFPRIGLLTPVGFSFYAFMAASYLIDVYSNRVLVERNAGKLALHVSFFPKILAGPIERATTFLPQIKTSLQPSPEMFVTGMQLIGWGMFKKVVIADNLAPFVDRTFKIAAYASPIDLLTSAYFFAFQIYCDFSGYSDMAIGIALLFGIRLMDNFKRPYFSTSVGEFWSNRWHISLGHWFRDYLYKPLGGSKLGVARQYINVMLVFVVSGLWHAGLGYGVGWTFLVWGALNGFYRWFGIASQPIWQRCGDVLPALGTSKIFHVTRMLVTFHLILIGWIFFRASTIEQAWTIISHIASNISLLPGTILKYPFTTEHYFGFGMIAVLLTVDAIDEARSIFQRLTAAPLPFRWTTYYVVIFATLLFGRWQGAEFIYMQF